MINFLNLEYFLVAAEELNFTRAARKLYISQQSLSNHISNLEKEFDVILFNRTSPLTLTYAGRALKTRARELLDLRDEFQRLHLAMVSEVAHLGVGLGTDHCTDRNRLFRIQALARIVRRKELVNLLLRRNVHSFESVR